MAGELKPKYKIGDKVIFKKTKKSFSDLPNGTECIITRVLLAPFIKEKNYTHYYEIDACLNYTYNENNLLEITPTAKILYGTKD